MSLLQFLRILWARRLIIIAATASCLIGALVVIMMVPPRYDSSARVMLNTLKPDPVTGEFIGNAALRTYVGTQMELIKDYRVAGQVVDQLGWQADPSLIAEYQNRATTDDRDFRRWLAQRIIDGTKTKMVPGSNILEITYTSRSPNSARAIADALRKAYIDSSLSARREEATRNADWFTAQAAKAKATLDAADVTKTDYERANGIVMQDDQSDIETARLRALSTQALVAPVVVQPAPPPSAGTLAQLDAQIAQTSQVLGANHPELLELRARRAALANQVAQEIAASRAAAGAGAAGANAAERALAAQKQKVIASRDKIERASQLQSEVTLRRDIYNRTMARAAQFRQEAAAADVGIAMLGTAVTPQDPSYPNKPLIIVGALGLGGGLGLFIALLVELLSRRVRGVEDLEWAVDAPMLAVIAGPSRRARGAAKRRQRAELSVRHDRMARA